MAVKRDKPEDVVLKLRQVKVPQKQPKKGRIWLNPLGTLLRNTLSGSGWFYDFVLDRTQGGRIFRTFNIIDEFTK